MKRTQCGTVSADQVGERVALRGWVHRRRDHGGVMFLDVRDRSGRVQVVVRPEEHADVSQALEGVRHEWVLAVEGVVARRAPEAINPQLRTGDIEVVADSARILAASEPLPFGIDGGGDASDETRLRHRFLDLRGQELQGNLALRHRVTMESMKFFDEHEFLNIETPMLTRSTPEGARDYLVPSRVHQGSFYALPQSPQLFKQILMVSGFERYVQIARCFRDEDLRADRQPEFTQIDVEMSFIDEEDVFSLIEGLFERLFPLVGIEPSTPFPRMAYDHAMRRYGSDRPDLRFGLEIEDLTEVWSSSTFRVFESVLSTGGVIRAVRVPGGAGASRKQVDKWADVVRLYGAQGVLTLKHRDGGVEFQVKDVLEPGQIEQAAQQLELEEGDLALVVAASESVAAASLGALRLKIAEELELIDESRHEFVWITDFPLVEWNSDESRWEALHHPFTSPLEEHLEKLDSDPGSVRARAYDVVLNGLELGGGSIRIHRQDVQNRVLGLLGIDLEEAEERFGFLLRALRFGAPPHGGIALGFDRLIMLMAGASSLRDVIAFPKTASASCLMTEAPSGVSADQLQDLGIRVARRPTIVGRDDGEGDRDGEGGRDDSAGTGSESPTSE